MNAIHSHGLFGASRIQHPWTALLTRCNLLDLRRPCEFSEDSPSGLELRQEDRRCRSRHGWWRRSHFVPLDTSYPSDPSLVIFLHARIPSRRPHSRASSSSVVAGLHWACRIYSLAGRALHKFFGSRKRSGLWHSLSHHRPAALATTRQVEFFLLSTTPSLALSLA